MLAEDGRNIGFGKASVANAWKNFRPAKQKKIQPQRKKSSALNAIIKFLYHLGLGRTSMSLPLWEKDNNFWSTSLGLKVENGLFSPFFSYAAEVTAMWKPKMKLEYRVLKRRAIHQSNRLSNIIYPTESFYAS